MNLRFLETFVWTARLGKMTLVAERLHATDAAISARIAAFEEEMGAKVFVRERGRQLTLTPAGAQMLPDAEALLATAHAFVARYATRQVAPPSIRIGMSGTVAAVILQPLVETLHANWPEVCMHLPALTSTDIRRQLLAGELDIGLLLGPVDTPQAVSLKLLELDYVWVASPRLIPLLQCPGIAQLKAHTFLSYPVDSDLFHAVTTYFDTPGLQGFKLNVLNSLPVMIRLACAGAGYALLPFDLIRHEIERGVLRKLDLPRPFARQTYYASFVDHPSVPLRRVLAEAICELVDGGEERTLS